MAKMKKEKTKLDILSVKVALNGDKGRSQTKFSPRYLQLRGSSCKRTSSAREKGVRNWSIPRGKVKQQQRGSLFKRFRLHTD